MDFFESQDQARRKSGRLVAMFALAVALIVAAVYAIAALLMNWLNPEMMGPGGGFWHPLLFAATAGVTVVVILGGSLYRIAQLRGGGGAVAAMMGGKPVDPSTRDPLERRFVNVVEEMALASGTPVPETFIMEEKGINAFAAGYSTGDAAVAVTRGCLEKLDRDELQGVVAHEFSHILNGDMRLNVRLIGLLNGILVLHLIGFTIIHSMRFTRVRGGGRGGRGGGGGGVIVFIFLMGGALMLIGWIGVFFGRIIQASVSRQREYLADAAAVQFTRNPGGIAGALKKIGGTRRGGAVKDPHAAECAHLFFTNAAASALSDTFATHPPLPKRIRAIDPSWDGEYAAPAPPKPPPRPADSTETKQRRSPADAFGMKPEVLLATIGTLGAGPQLRARRLITEIPEPLREAVRDPLGAEAAVLALLLGQDAAHLDARRQIIQREAGEHCLAEINRLGSNLARLGPEHRLPLAELAVPALRRFSPDQFAAFKRTAEALITADNSVSLFEFALEKTVLHQLEVHFSERADPPVKYHDTASVGDEIVLLLSALARAGDKNTAAAFKGGVSRLRGISAEAPLSPGDCGIPAVSQALDKLRLASFPVKKQFLDAAVFVITVDGKVAADEGELLRAIAETLDCPMPPLVG